ncbi:MAG TPA: ABC transporter substrate-binding protein [Trebonia sp.]|jgi:ABC-type branched-subunit amino acid transport system substrate-binding protein|nr:ABC transporter substrate-binding protein [Trebonia sp.]
MAVLAAAILAAGCSSSSGSKAGSTGSPSALAASAAGSAPATAGASPVASAAGTDIGLTTSTIRIAMIADVNNPLVPGLFQDSVNAVKAWASEVNASGGLAGRKVVVDFCDGRLDPNATSNCVIRACQTDFAMVGTAANALEDLSDIDGCKNAAGKAIGIANLPAFAFPPAACDPKTYLFAGVGTYCKTAKEKPPTSEVPVGDARYLTKNFQNLHGIWLYDSDDPTFKQTQTPTFQAESNLGIKKDGQGFYALSGSAPQSALTPFIQVIKSSGSTFVYDDVTTSSMVLLRREAKLQGVNSVKVWECNSGCYDPTFYQQGGAAVNGTYAMLLNLPYLSDYKTNPALGKLVTKLGGISKLNNNAMNSFIEALLFQDAVNKAAATGTLNRQTLFTALGDEHSFTADGLIGPADVGNRKTSGCEVIVQLQNGVWNRVDPVKPGTFDCGAKNNTIIKYAPS